MGLALPLLVGSASAATTPPWEPDPNAVGTLTFYNSAGQVVTGGSDLTHLFDYALASTKDATNGTKAVINFAAPAPGVLTANFFAAQQSVASTFPNMSAPAPLNTSPNPVAATTLAADVNLTNFIAQVPAQTATGYANVFQVRLVTSGIGTVGTVNTGQYWDADVVVNPTAGTWSQEYPTGATATATTLTASPNPTSVGVSTTLTATETPATAGSVTFSNGTTTLGTATVNASGVATLPTTFTAAGTDSLSAVFTPTSSSFSSSTGSLSLTVNPAVTSTTTSLTASPATSAQQGASVMLTATETPATAGSVAFFQDGFQLGSAVAVNSSGVATTSTNTLLPSKPNGTSLTATFTPTSSSFSGSTGTLPYTVNPVATKPTISGAHTAGKSESCSEGTLDFGVTATYTWQLTNGTKIGSGASFTVPGTAYKKSIECVASVSDGGGPSSSAISSSVVVSRGGALTAKKSPTLSGPHKVGRTEKVNPGNWNDPGVSGVTFSYQWFINGKAIRHATKSTFKPTRGDKGKKLSCRVTAHAQGFANGSKTTSSVKVS